MTEELLLCDEFDSPVGRLSLAVTERGVIRQLSFDRIRLPANARAKEAENPFELRLRLQSYFDGNVGELDQLQAEALGTDFQRRVWAALRAIPVGTTTTYKQIAVALGKPTAMRAVGGANHVNPIGIVVPCHRVIGHDGTLTGYAGGLKRKAWLLAHEARHAPARRGQQLAL
jgi:methylated-DNA-[protein]-cysteine S-methyltransferase